MVQGDRLAHKVFLVSGALLAPKARKASQVLLVLRVL